MFLSFRFEGLDTGVMLFKISELELPVLLDSSAFDETLSCDRFDKKDSGCFILLGCFLPFLMVFK